MTPHDPADQGRDSHFADSDEPCPRPECRREYHALASGFIDRPGNLEIAGVESVCFIPASDDREAAMYFHLHHHEVVEADDTDDAVETTDE